MRRVPLREALLTASGTAVSAGIRVTDYKTCVLSIAGSATTASLKVFVKGSIGDTKPDFTVDKAIRSATNNWDYLDVVDLEDNASIDGDTGVDLASNVIRNVELNVNALDWIAVHATAIVAGTVTVTMLAVTNE